MGPEIRGRVSIHPGKTFLSDHGLPRALPCRPWTFKASGSTPAGGLFFFLERPACMTLAWPSRPGCVASATGPTITTPAPRAGLASPCLPSGPCRADRHAPATSPQCIPNPPARHQPGVPPGRPTPGPGLPAGDRRRRAAAARRRPPWRRPRPVAGAPVALRRQRHRGRAVRLQRRADRHAAGIPLRLVAGTGVAGSARLPGQRGVAAPVPAWAAPTPLATALYPGLRPQRLVAGAPRRLARPGPGDPWRLLQLRLERHGGAGGASAGDRRDHLPR